MASTLYMGNDLDAQPDPAEFRLSWGGTILILAYGASLLLSNLGSSRVLTYHEALYAQSAKEILASGNWILPTFAGIPNTHKPPGNHAFIALMMAISGRQDEAIVRLPAVLSSLITAWLIGVLAARWFGNRVGVVAGLAHVTMYHVLQLARLSESDMPMIMSVCGAMVCFAFANIDSPLGKIRTWWIPILFYGATGAAFLFKGLIGPAFILSGCGAFLLWQREWSIFRFLVNPFGILLFLICTLGWYFAAWTQHPEVLDALLRHHVGRFQGDLGGEKPAWFYPVALLLVMLPWSPWVMLGSFTEFREGLFRQPLGRFLLCWVIPGLVLLSMSEFKSQHYVAPLIPPLTVLGAIGLLQWIRLRQGLSVSWHLITAATSLLGCFTAGVIVGTLQPEAHEIILALITLLAISLALLSYWEFRKRTICQLSTLFGTAWICAVVVLSVVMPRYDSYRDQTELALRINDRLPEGEPIYLVKLPRNQITFYLKPPVVRIDDPARFSIATASDLGARYVLAPEFVADALAQLGNTEVLDRCISINRYLTPRDRLTLIRLDSDGLPDPTNTAEAETKGPVRAASAAASRVPPRTL